MADSNFTEADGRQLAVDMLRHIGRQWLDNDEIDADADPDNVNELLINREPDILRRNLATVRDANCPMLERGFLCILNEFIGAALAGSALDVEAYENYIEPVARHG